MDANWRSKIGRERVSLNCRESKKWIQDDKRNQYENKNIQSTWNEQCYNRKSIRSHRISDLPPHETLNDIITSWPRKYLLRNLSNHHSPTSMAEIKRTLIWATCTTNRTCFTANEANVTIKNPPTLRPSVTSTRVLRQRIQKVSNLLCRRLDSLVDRAGAEGEVVEAEGCDAATRWNPFRSGEPLPEWVILLHPTSRDASGAEAKPSSISVTLCNKT